jgi:hypothetical protein
VLGPRFRTFLQLSLASLLCGPLLAARAQAPMQQQARRAAQLPMKLGVRPLVQTARVGNDVSVEVAMLDANNQPATWSRPCQVEAEISGPSGEPQKFKISIPPNQSAATFTFRPTQPGLHTIKAHEENDSLLPGGNSVLVSNPAPAKPSGKSKPSRLPFAPADSQAHLMTISTGAEFRSPLPASDDQTPQGPATAPPSAPELLLTNASGKDEILADGKDFARIQVYYMDPNGGAAPSDITVWLKWSNGKLDAQPLVIKKGSAFGETQWTSLSPVNAELFLVSSAPNFAVKGRRELQVSFAPAIYGIAPSGPNPLKLSLIDCQPVVVQLFDQEGRTVQTTRVRHVTFISSNPSLHLDPDSRDLSPNDSEASVFLVPTWAGTSTLEIWTPDYDHQTLQVQVSMWLVLVLCLSGGVVGGIAARDALKGSTAWRIFVGVLGAVVLVWIIVYAVLPQTHSIIAHNLVSVFVVAIVGGYGGTRVLDFAAKKLGYL